MSRRYLLDTHILLWWLASDRRLSAATRRMIEASARAVSVVSLVVIAMKAAAGKLRLPSQPLDERPNLAGITILALKPAHGQAARA